MTSVPRLVGDIPFSRSEIDRDHASRTTPGFIATLLRDSATRVVFMHKTQVPIVDGQLTFFTPDSVPEAFPTAVYLGKTVAASGSSEPLVEGTPLVLVVVDDVSSVPVEADAWQSLRDVGHSLGIRDAGIVVEAIAIANWHASARFCIRCGGQTTAQHAGWMRHCEPCNAESFPRTDPAVIVRVLDRDGRILLGSNALWPEGRYSLLAGFVEAGESLETAVVREIAEEAGIRVTNPRYLGSQPWPFPCSMMLGFEAVIADDQDAAATLPDGEEILDVRWFTRDEIRDPEPGLTLPGPTSIAHAIIEDWLTEANGS